MATSKPASKKPAAKSAKAEQPASGKTVKDLAKALNRDPKSVRAAIRRLRGGPQVGRGNRYSFSDGEFEALVNDLSPKSKNEG